MACDPEARPDLPQVAVLRELQQGCSARSRSWRHLLDPRRYQPRVRAGQLPLAGCAVVSITAINRAGRLIQGYRHCSSRSRRTAAEVRSSITIIIKGVPVAEIIIAA